MIKLQEKYRNSKSTFLLESLMSVSAKMENKKIYINLMSTYCVSVLVAFRVYINEYPEKDNTITIGVMIFLFVWYMISVFLVEKNVGKLERERLFLEKILSDKELKKEVFKK